MLCECPLRKRPESSVRLPWACPWLQTHLCISVPHNVLQQMADKWNTLSHTGQHTNGAVRQIQALLAVTQAQSKSGHLHFPFPCFAQVFASFIAQLAAVAQEFHDVCYGRPKQLNRLRQGSPCQTQQICQTLFLNSRERRSMRQQKKSFKLQVVPPGASHDAIA